jgi:hypothetical protein
MSMRILLGLLLFNIKYVYNEETAHLGLEPTHGSVLYQRELVN